MVNMTTLPKQKKQKQLKTVFNTNTPKSVTKLSQISQLQRCFLYSFYLLTEKNKSQTWKPISQFTHMEISPNPKNAIST